MSHSLAITTTGAVDGVQKVNATQTVSDNGLLSYNDAVVTGTTNQPCRIAFVKAQLQGFQLYSDQAITLKTNSTTTPQDTISLPARTPVTWMVGGVLACPFANDVTEIYVTNASGSTANVELDFIAHISV